MKIKLAAIILLTASFVMLFCSCATRRDKIDIETVTEEQLNQIVKEKKRSLIQMCKLLKLNPENGFVMPNGTIEDWPHRFRLSNRYLFLDTNEHDIVTSATFAGLVDPADATYQPGEKRK